MTVEPWEKETLFPPIVVRYDGLDAERHEIELGALGESLQGVSRIIGVAANFAAPRTVTPSAAHCDSSSGMLSMDPYTARTLDALFAPQPGKPGKPSAVSPTSAK